MTCRGGRLRLSRSDLISKASMTEPIVATSARSLGRGIQNSSTANQTASPGGRTLRSSAEPGPSLGRSEDAGRWIRTRTVPGRVRIQRPASSRSEEHTSELQSLRHLVCRLLLEKKNGKKGSESVRVYDQPTYADN